MRVLRVREGVARVATFVLSVLLGASGEDETPRRENAEAAAAEAGLATIYTQSTQSHHSIQIQSTPANVMAQTKQHSRDDLVEEYDIDPMEKDDTELELERRLFGDPEGFRNNLKLHPKGDDARPINDIQKLDGESSEEEADESLEGLHDSAVRTLGLSIEGFRG